MKAIKPLNSVLFLAIMSLVISAVTGWNPVASFIGLTLMSLVPMPKGVALMAVTREVWTKDIVENLYKDNAFATRAFNADMHVLKGKVVHIPVAGAASTITKNATVFPVTAVKRTDTDINYNLDTFYSTPRHIEQIEKYELEYDKRQSVLGEDQRALTEAAMEALIYNWLPLVGKTTLTTGAARAATLSGATGNRNKFDKAQFSTIKLLMDAAKVPVNGRVALLTAYHYNDFLASLDASERTDVGRVADMKTGVVAKYLGFDIYMRSTVGRYSGADGAYTKVDEQDAGFGATDQTDDRAASIFWHDMHVERALGEVDIFDNPRQAEYYGDVVSMILRLGGRIRNTAGVYAAVEAIA
jgi:hypothetical protein